MNLVVSLVGPTGAGKSTVADILMEELVFQGHSVKIIKKDDAIKVLAGKRYHRLGYRLGYIVGLVRISSGDLNQEINRRLKASPAEVVILEGGTRTTAARAITLKEVDRELVSLYFEVRPGVLVARLRRRHRSRPRRIDDAWPLMLGKLIGQWRGSHSPEAIRPDTPGVITIDANQNLYNVAGQAFWAINTRSQEAR